ncbi:PREDICTED: uncharacterized protein KIAA1143 homolog [Papilio polytes]|uniref:uncharacterized protein KIAA1143 homolog n=1 Tax=Papilio polytes TaxID=76194 RepID=UPI0006767C0E|nr:PREDICTED: uncharacterized protein KIAA1143 homolog [Papilio polytes]
MNRKRNVSYIKPEDPHFLKMLKKEAGYDDTNHKFDKLENKDEDFVDDEESEKPQVVVLKDGDLTAEEAEVETKRLEKEKNETKADLSQKVIFQAKLKPTMLPDSKSQKRKNRVRQKPSSQLLSFAGEEDVGE